MKKLTSLAALLLVAATAAAQQPSAQQQPAQKPAAQQPTAQQPAPAQAAPGDKPQSLEDKASYIIGFNLGSNLKQQEIPVSADLIVKGLRDGLGGAKGLLTDEEIQASMTEFQQQMMAKQQAKMQAAGAKNKQEAEAFLASNKGKQGVVTTASGLQYQILKEGTGPNPKPTDQVTVHYKGTLLDGTVFDSSYDRNEPATFTVGQVIPGWVEALQLMKIGSKAKLFIPPALAYGESGAGQGIGPNALLIFEVELLKAEPAPPEGDQPGAPGGAAEGEQGQPQTQGEQKPPQG
ncbi:MAG TPA: FKBP-type peptidyl-prolyl cis-trans isomerase [Thermoanaerobaculia bacterium]|nr:FKBP-type peptidyl-prolyl cis-trans isomerase [Thermoanaerobaculia bacterium]